MPDVPEFLKGFNLIKGNNFDGYTLENVEASHEVVRKYREYKYPISLTLKKRSKNGGSDSSSISELLPSLNEEIKKEHIIYGIRNPYRCFIKFQSLSKNSDTVVVKLMGIAYRA